MKDSRNHTHKKQTTPNTLTGSRSRDIPRDIQIFVGILNGEIPYGGIPHGGVPHKGTRQWGNPMVNPTWGVPHGGSPMGNPTWGIPHWDPHGETLMDPQVLASFFCGDLHSHCKNHKSIDCSQQKNLFEGLNKIIVLVCGVFEASVSS